MVNSLSNKKRVFLFVVIGLVLATLSSVAYISTLQITIHQTAVLPGNAYLASNLGISTAAAKKAIDIIDTASTIASIISLIGVVTGAGAISYAVVATAKRLAKKYSKKYAAAW
ncbi:uberolysin/carnocyclin family circular bacteriocin [Heyndrickxia coagulans]|uniref:uberolysin/carnocyclin family circular bacteriocin n=1 Tax=Heyndrickxia TaxID=2837504 RepID=UPI002EBA7B37|nr:uberolysin/carnocyclin family circular bacteriocin [Heyndrickxia coagulans]